MIVTDQGSVDEVGTTKLRKDMSAERGELPLFNYGPSIEQLRETCEAETGLEAPKQPVWKRPPESIAAE